LRDVVSEGPNQSGTTRASSITAYPSLAIVRSLSRSCGKSSASSPETAQTNVAWQNRATVVHETLTPSILVSLRIERSWL